MRTEARITSQPKGPAIAAVTIACEIPQELYEAGREAEKDTKIAKESNLALRICSACVISQGLLGLQCVPDASDPFKRTIKKIDGTNLSAGDLERLKSATPRPRCTMIAS